MPTIASQYRRDHNHALVLGCLMLALVVGAAVAWALGTAAAFAQAPDLAPVLPAGPAPAADPLTGLLTTLGPTGGAGAVVAWLAYQRREERRAAEDEARRHAEERRELRDRQTAQAERIAGLELQIALTRQTLDHVHALLRQP